MEAEEESTAEQYRKRAAKMREILKAAQNPELLAHLDSVAREYEETADRLERQSTGLPKPE